jgi:hypothetical protein
MKKIYYLMLLSLITFQLNAQLSSHPFNDETTIHMFVKVGVAYNAVKYPDALAAGVVSIDFDASHSTFEKGGLQLSMRFPSLGDVFFPAFIELVGFTFQQKATPGVDGNLGSTSLSSLLLGWHNVAWAFISNDHVNVAGGFHLGDYSYGFNRYIPSARYSRGDPLSFGDFTDPSGYYIGFGPAFVVDVAIVNDLIFHYEGAYAFSGRILKKGSNVAPKNSPNPIFLNQQFSLRYRHFFFGVEYCSVLQNNEAAHAGRRLAFLTGLTLY